MTHCWCYPYMQLFPSSFKARRKYTRIFLALIFVLLLVTFMLTFQAHTCQLTSQSAGPAINRLESQHARPPGHVGSTKPHRQFVVFPERRTKTAHAKDDRTVHRRYNNGRKWQENLLTPHDDDDFWKQRGHTIQEVTSRWTRQPNVNLESNKRSLSRPSFLSTNPIDGTELLRSTSEMLPDAVLNTTTSNTWPGMVLNTTTSNTWLGVVLNTTTSNTWPGVVLTVLVISRPNNVRLRQAARQTWGQSSRLLGVELRFVVGRQENWDDIVDRETRLHNDVIVVEEEDRYENLANKVLRGFTWVLSQTTQAKYLMKIDDDTFVNLPYLLQELHLGFLKSTQIMGAICINSTVIRDPLDKWAVSFLDFPFTTYPTYAFGGGYVMSTVAAASLVRASSSSTEWIHLEDVYITGLLARKCNLTHVTHPAFSYWMTKKATACDFVLNKRVTSVNHTEREIYGLYSNVQLLLRSRNTTTCFSH